MPDEDSYRAGIFASDNSHVDARGANLSGWETPVIARRGSTVDVSEARMRVETRPKSSKIYSIPHGDIDWSIK